MNHSSNKGKYIQIVQDKFLARSLLFDIYQQHYNTLLRYIKNDKLKGLDAYPDNVSEAIYIMNNYCTAPDADTPGRHTTHTFSGVQFE